MTDKQKLPFGLWPSPVSPSMLGAQLDINDAQFDSDGSLLWEHSPWTGEPEKIHQMNSWASATCVTDGEIVVAFFGKGGLHAYSLDGKLLWSRDLGPFEGPWGVAACPIIVGDLVIQNGDADQEQHDGEIVAELAP